MKPMIVAHGGAWDWGDDLDADKRAGVERAIHAGKQVLDQGGAALDAVEQTVLALEDDPTFDAGTGGFLNRDGEVQLDALIIDGATVDFGAIAGVRRIRNPITLARAVMEQTEQVMFVGEDADRIATTLGVDLGRKRNAGRSRYAGLLRGAENRWSQRHCWRDRHGQGRQFRRRHFDELHPVQTSGPCRRQPIFWRWRLCRERRRRCWGDRPGRANHAHAAVQGFVRSNGGRPKRAGGGRCCNCSFRQTLCKLDVRRHRDRSARWGGHGSERAQNDMRLGVLKRRDCVARERMTIVPRFRTFFACI